MKSPLLSALALLLFLPAAAPAQTANQACMDCHGRITPGIVADWKASRHNEAGVECATCHGSAHTTATDAAKALIPTPETCAPCHQDRVDQFKKGKHAMAWAAIGAMPTIHWQPMAMIDGMKGCGACHKLGLKTAAEDRKSVV